MAKSAPTAPHPVQSRRDAVADGVLACKQLLARFLVGFDDTNHTRQPNGLPNHAAWCLGHLALTTHRASELIDGRPLPDTDFTKGPEESAQVTRYSTVPATRFSIESVAFGSQPVDDARQYPDFLRCGEIFNRACDRLAASLRAADDATLDKSVKWGQSELPAYLLAMRMIWHIGCHTGQLTDLRRGLGMRPVLR